MKLRKYLSVILGIIISAISFDIFFIPYSIIPSGNSGIAIIFHKLFNINEALTILLLSMMLLIIGFMFLEKEEVKHALLGSFLFPLFIYLFSITFKNIDLSIDNNLLTAIVGGVGLGFGLGIIYREGHYLGGFDLLNRIISEHTRLDFSTATMITDIIVVLSGAFVFGFQTFIYSSVTIVIYRLMIDKVILGIGDSRSFYIITTKPKEIKKMIIDELGHGVTVLKGKGAYSKADCYILFVVIPKRDYYKLKDGLKNIDKDAFFVVSSSYEVGGGR